MRLTEKLKKIALIADVETAIRATFDALKSLANYENPGKKEEKIVKETVNKK